MSSCMMPIQIHYLAEAWYLETCKIYAQRHPQALKRYSKNTVGFLKRKSSCLEIQAKYLPNSPFSGIINCSLKISWRGGRVVECGGLENR